jgi:hypothetical protein
MNDRVGTLKVNYMKLTKGMKWAIGLALVVGLGKLIPDKGPAPAKDYEVIDKMDHLSKRMNAVEGYYMGSILVKDVNKDSLAAFSRRMVEIARFESMGQFSVYTSLDCYEMDSGRVKPFSEDKMGQCYVGKIDASAIGTGWKGKLVPEMFQPNAGFWGLGK